jgi:SAM-dependent methyltransferase
LDIGCGDGPLTLKIAEAVGNDGEVLGIDASASMIQAAEKLALSNNVSNCKFMVDNCNEFAETTKTSVLNGTWDSVFSNAALHWILRPPARRLDALKAAYDALKHNGRFVFEFGGAGNVAEVVTALIYAQTTHGVSLEQARDSIPWFFPDTQWMDEALTKIGFKVQQLELIYRPTKLNPESSDGTGGLEGWIRLFGASILSGNDQADAIVKEACSVLESVVRRPDGSQWLGYVRLRGAAIKA